MNRGPRVDCTAIWCTAIALRLHCHAEMRAIDQINHGIPISKLEHYDILGITSAFSKSYLTYRTQNVFISRTPSYFKSIACGVPQRIIL